MEYNTKLEENTALLPPMRARKGRAMGLITLALTVSMLSSSLTAAFLSISSNAPEPKRRNFSARDYINPDSLGQLKPSVRANLRPDLGYIRAIDVPAGHVNQIQVILNLVYLAKMTRRVPIIPRIVSNAHVSSAGSVLLSDIYDLPRFMSAIDLAVLEWPDVKPEGGSSGTTDWVGCWQQERELGWSGAKMGRSVDDYGAELTTWPLPNNAPSHTQITFEAAADLTWAPPDASYFRSLVDRSPETWPSADIVPDGHLFCFTSTYFLRPQRFASTGFVDQSFIVGNAQWEQLDPTLWSTIGQHLRFNEKYERLRDHTLKAVGLSPSRPFIAVHVRHGDFCWPDPCPADLSKYAAAVDQVRASGCPATRKTPVVIISDDTRPEMHQEAARLGWTLLDHNKLGTASQPGRTAWNPPLIDSAILAHAIGAVYTAGSTFSSIGAFRARDWQGACIERVLPHSALS